MTYIDFAALKQSITIEDVAKLLGLQLKLANKQLRGKCPHCEGGDRSLVITPEKEAYYCFTDEKGGDLIALAAHIKNCSMKEAAQFIHSSLTVPPKDERPAEGMQPLQHLDNNHEAVQAIGFVPEDAAKLGIGYAAKGLMRGTVAVPLRTETGALVGYIGITEARLPPSLKFPTDGNVVAFPKKTA